MEIEATEDVVPLNAVTLRRLERFARGLGKPVGAAAADLLRDLLADEEFWEAAEDAAAARATLN
jgi:hypothetical protein